MVRSRMPAVAGIFYPDDPVRLRENIRNFLSQAGTDGPVPKAMIVPHAGYIYSGPIAASAYARLSGAKGRIRRVVLLGPAHRLGFDGLAAHSAETFATPLGSVSVDRRAVEELLSLPQVRVLDEAHENEHSLEVHLPFLQELLEDFTLVPLAVGSAGPVEVAEVLDRLWGGEETLVVVSSDLSHYLDYDTAKMRDAATSNAIVNLRPEDLRPSDACGYYCIGGLLVEAREKHLMARAVDLRNSGDTAGPRDQVVGYGAYVFT
jgi:AmmeMemoRadiSam system protein B